MLGTWARPTVSINKTCLSNTLSLSVYLIYIYVIFVYVYYISSLSLSLSLSLCLSVSLSLSLLIYDPQMGSVFVGGSGLYTTCVPTRKPPQAYAATKGAYASVSQPRADVQFKCRRALFRVGVC